MTQHDRTLTSPLFHKIRQYLQENDSSLQTFYILVPFIRTNMMRRLVEGLQSKIIVVTTWKPQDLLAGSSELGLYDFCKQSDITMYVNNRIHLKVYSANFESMILATANISERGLGSSMNHNMECATMISDLSNNDRMYLHRILNDSVHIDDQIYDKLSSWYDAQEEPPPIQEDMNWILDMPKKDHFLISALPMTKSIKILRDSYEKLSNGVQIDDPETQDCVFHDLANYSIDLGLSASEFEARLRAEFFSHPFIKKIDEFICPEAFFGRIKQWVQDNCTTVPVPSRRELTTNVQVLLEWFEELGDGRYVVDIPGRHSQRIKRTDK